MTIEEVLSKPIQEQVSIIKSSKDDKYEERLKDAVLQLDPHTHTIIKDTITRKDRRVPEVKLDENGNVTKTTNTIKVNRIAVPFQQKIVNDAVEFLFGNNVKLSSTYEDAEVVLNAIKAIGEDNKIDTFNRQLARTLFTSSDVAEYWYIPDDENEEHEDYGFKTDSRIKVQLLSPLDECRLYPYFNEYKKMTAFAWESSITIDSKKVYYFNIITTKEILRYKKDGSSDWIADTPKENQRGKIYINYYDQKYSEWYFVQYLIDRYEKIKSNNGDTNDRHATPILAATGTVSNMIGDFVQMDGDSRLEYISWNQGTQSIKEESDDTKKLIYEMSDTLPLSLDEVRGLGNIAGSSLELLFAPPHMKVKRKMEIFDAGLTRRYNIVKDMLISLTEHNKEEFANKVKKTKINIEITPYMIGGESDIINNLKQLYDSKGISLQTMLEHNPYVEDSVDELERIKSENKTIPVVDKNELKSA